MRRIPNRGRATASAPPGTTDIWSAQVHELLPLLGTSGVGLSSNDALLRLARDGPNQLEQGRHQGTWGLLRRQFVDPIVVLLIAAASISFVLQQVVDALIILAIVGLSGLLGFSQERRAGHAIKALSAMVRVHADVRRDGAIIALPLSEVVIGDVIELNAGDLVPCDCRLLHATDLLVDASALTGEAYPVHKAPAPPQAELAQTARTDVLLLGSHVASGRGVAVAVATGRATQFGQLAGELAHHPRRSAFERGIGRFGLLIGRVTLVLAAAILVVNLALGRAVADAVLFSLALAVGLTPQMLPVIVSVSLATGARQMAARQVIVRRLDAIEDFGSMDVLCTDKTGTLTEGQIRLELALDVAGEPNAHVARLAAINAGLQSGFSNPLDIAIATQFPVPDAVALIDEIPFDFTRKRLGVLAEHNGTRELIVKGAFTAVLDVCDTVDFKGNLQPLQRHRTSLEQQFEQLSRDGFRVLGVASALMPTAGRVSVQDEVRLTLRGLLVFADPPKEDAAIAVRQLREAGVTLQMLTGDNRFAAAHAAARVGLDASTVITGAEVAAFDEDELRRVVQSATVYAELDPIDKQRIIEALRTEGLTVGYLGDGINDVGALQRADVGISVDTAVDVAKQTADIVLLAKDLEVLTDGVKLGRQTFANTLKYVFTTVSANFGNVLSIAAASAFLPFLPLLPRQILLLNFLSDIPSTMIARDRVDREQRERPQHWNMRFIRDFMVTFGLVSTGFDLLTFAILLQVFNASPTLFRTGWFVGSTLTELAVLFVLRTRRPAIRSRPGRALVVTSVVVGGVALTIPYVSAIAGPLGLQPLQANVVGTLVAIIATYIVATELINRDRSVAS